MADEHLNVQLASVWLYDWMHTMLIEGVLCKELRACIRQTAADGFIIDTCRAYLHSFTTPQCMPSGARLCDKVSPDGTASEWLSAVPVIRKLLIDVISENVTESIGAVNN